MSITFRRKMGQPNTANKDAGELVVMPKGVSRKRAWRERKVYAPGDTIAVDRIEDLPGWPHQIDGWERISSTPGAPQIPEETTTPAVLRARHRGRGMWEVVVEVPGSNYLLRSGGPPRPIGKGQKVHEGFLPRARAEKWAEIGSDPGEEF